MINIPASLKKDIGQLADVLNQFKSEAVQVKLLDRFLSGISSVASSAAQLVASPTTTAATPKRRGRPPGSKNVSTSAVAAPKRRGRPPGSKNVSTSAVAVPKRRGRPPGSGKKKGGKVGRPPKAATPAKVGRPPGRKRSKMGATGALHKLLESGFFKTHRSIADVTDACKNKLGLEIAVTNLSGPLMRFVGEKKLVRAKNKEDKFEYWAK
jgi:hypothetical protein